MTKMGALTEQLPRAGQGARTFRLETGRSFLAGARFATAARGPPTAPEMVRADGWLHRLESPKPTQDRDHVTGGIITWN